MIDISLALLVVLIGLLLDLRPNNWITRVCSRIMLIGGLICLGLALFSSI